jgi:hypothetical protein
VARTPCCLAATARRVFIAARKQRNGGKNGKIENESERQAAHKRTSCLRACLARNRIYRRTFRAAGSRHRWRRVTTIFVAHLRRCWQPERRLAWQDGRLRRASPDGGDFMRIACVSWAWRVTHVRRSAWHLCASLRRIASAHLNQPALA